MYSHVNSFNAQRCCHIYRYYVIWDEFFNPKHIPSLKITSTRKPWCNSPLFTAQVDRYSFTNIILFRVSLLKYHQKLTATIFVPKFVSRIMYLDITYSITMTTAVIWLEFIRYTQYLVRKGQLWSVHCGNVGGDWPRYTGTIFYIPNKSFMVVLPLPPHHNHPTATKSCKRNYIKSRHSIHEWNKNTETYYLIMIELTMRYCDRATATATARGTEC